MDQESLFGSPPPSPRPSAIICDSECRLTDTQNVGTIALPGSHPYSELPISPLALPSNHSTVYWPPAQPQAQPVPTSSGQPWQPPPAPMPASKGSKRSRQSSHSPPCNDSPPQSRDPEISLPDPSALPPAHFLRNQQNLLGQAGLVAGVKPATITHIRGTTPSSPIIIDDDDDAPILGRQSQSRDIVHTYVNPALLTAPSDEDIVSVLIAQKDIFPILKGILDLIGKGTTRQTPTPPLQTHDDPTKCPPVKRRKLHRVPAGAADWDVPYPFPEGEGPKEYHQTWERERGKRLIAQLVKLIKVAARKAATKNYLRKEQARQAAWEKLQREMMPPVVATPNQDSPVVNSTNLQNSNPLDDDWSSFTTSDDPSLLKTWMTFLQAFPVAFDSQSQPQSSLVSSQASTPNLDDFGFVNTIDNSFDQSRISLASSQESTPGLDFTFTNTMNNNFDFFEERSSSTSNTPAIPDDFPALISSMLNSLPQNMEFTPFSSSSSSKMDMVLPPFGSSTIYKPQDYPTSASIPQLPSRPTTSQSRKEEILRHAREKRRQVQEELDRTKTQLWETTIEQAALVHLLKRFDENSAV